MLRRGVAWAKEVWGQGSATASKQSANLGALNMSSKRDVGLLLNKTVFLLSSTATPREAQV